MRVVPTLRALLLAAVGFAASGCPAVLDDNFTVVPAEQAGTDKGGTRPEGGMAGSVGGKVTMGDAGMMDAGGAGMPSGGKGQAGSGGSGGTEALLGGAGGEGGQFVDPDPCAHCGANEKCCEGACVDTRFDPNNCMMCGHGCPGTTCDSSSCTNTCAAPFIDCNRNVVDGCEVNPAVDPKNCGNCGIECGFGLECVKGYCVCPVGTADCDGVKDNGCEVDTTSDKASCGACRKACASNEACMDSQCGCGVGFLDCNAAPSDGCEASVTDNATCGSCNLDCGPHGLCVAAGQCGCAPGYLDCDKGVPGCETPVNDPAHCGACDVSCPANLPACDGTKCIIGCGALTACGASCVDTKTDPENCGGCAKPVGENQVCVAGKPTCVAGFADCDANPLDCEVNTQTDAANCGVCNKACKPGAECNAGNCACSPTTPNDCGATCAQCCDASQCSDGNSCTADTCSNGVCSSGAVCEAGGTMCCSGTGCFACCSDDDCASGKVCTGNQCVTLTCQAPQIVCNSKCVNPTNDAKNCGGCDNSCGPGRTCSASACTPRWVATATPPVGFVAREKAAYAAMGSKVFVWGGNDATAKALNDGAAYDPATNTWSSLAATGTPPSARVMATAVWTGSVVVVWGGGDLAGNADYSSGSRYDPSSDSWQTMTTTGAPVGRRGAYGFWTGSRVLFYGGVDRNGNASNAVNLYDPVNDAWSTIGTSSAPNPRTEPTVGWSGSQLLLYGGRVSNTATQNTYVLDVASNKWIRGADGPTARYGALGTWDGSLLGAWGGANNGVKNDGKVYEPVGDKWTTMQAMGSPSGRYSLHRQTGWAARLKPRVTLLLGGYGANGYLTDGSMYNSTTNAWTAVNGWPSGASHLWGVAVWTGSEFVLWSGRSGTSSSLTTSGERYLP